MHVQATTTVTPDHAVAHTRATYLQDARRLEDDIYSAVDTLTATGALPRDGWRFLAHILFCRATYATHIQPLEGRMTLEQIANHLNAINLPRFRGQTPWTAPAITDIRQVVASPDNQIALPGP